jgi:GPI mannosyltransferase 3
VFAFAAPIVYFGHRALSETFSALPVVFGFALAMAPKARTGRRLSLLAGASLLGFATLLRLQNALFGVALLVVLAARRDWRGCREAGVVLAGWGFLLGLLDQLTWGSWFNSAREYIRVTLIEGGAEKGWGGSPWHYYIRVLLQSMPLLTIVVGPLALGAWRRAPGLLFVCALFFVLHSWTPHKELRFLLPVAPLLCALAAVGLDALRDRTNASLARFAPHLLVILALWSGLHAGRLTFGEMGAYGPEKTRLSAWGDFADVNRLLLLANEREDLCGLKVESTHVAWTGGLSHLHRDVPYYPRAGPPRESGDFNYILTRAGKQAGEVVARDGANALVRLRDGCVPDPTYTGGF